MIDTVAPRLAPERLFHVGIVVDDMDVARAELSALLGLDWAGGEPLRMTLCLYGSEREVTMRIAHSIQGPPHYELIQALPDSPWAAPAARGVHHLCYSAPDPVATCAALEAAGMQRVLGRAGSGSGYFQAPGGLLVEIVDEAMHARLRGMIARAAARGR
ncbi:MAG: VOC family protein [Gammaproteobacteria bacterium]